ncbi:MAG: hypothetical protein A2998_02515 [Candidatus Staskawiczbacteria bacterium RIFCSPLOWO2_01_FULL_37_25b]|uniref:Uncharacterized protein n=1 Tax=Candidatus Staskawiczbacteria bacterium RIFCSPLOWO2_01_FULL_37_25b TaxID=1802213 RepID=A0A1G2IDS2_9BACT|nr:MAG: hypothetical protein A2998_02515 [Candidatus Staskawiczbacteria bacterium RIFCSPLOWO2_01_FULL_37_25b]
MDLVLLLIGVILLAKCAEALAKVSRTSFATPFRPKGYAEVEFPDGRIVWAEIIPPGGKK